MKQNNKEDGKNKDDWYNKIHKDSNRNFLKIII